MKALCTAAVILLAGGLTGCASLEGKLENRLACAVAGDRLFAVSEYGPVGITSRISEADRQVVCKKP